MLCETLSCESSLCEACCYVNAGLQHCWGTTLYQEADWSSDVNHDKGMSLSSDVCFDVKHLIVIEMSACIHDFLLCTIFLILLNSVWKFWNFYAVFLLVIIITCESSYCFQRVLAIAILSVHPSITQVGQSKAVQVRITKSSLSAAWKTLVSGTI